MNGSKTRGPEVRPLYILIPLLLAIGLGGCMTVGPSATTPPVGAPGPIDPLDPTAQPQTQPGGGGGLSVGQRAQSALESMVMGAVLGSQFGPLGAAAGAGTMLIYGALTGNVPFSGFGRGRRGGGGYGGYGGGGGGYDPGGYEAQREAALESEIENEMERGSALENEIEAELSRQEELLRQIENQENAASAAANAPAPQAPSTTQASVEDLSERADPRAAPRAPKDRDLPVAIFDEDRVVIPKGSWDNKKKIEVVKRSLDADRDGNPEQVRYFDQKSGKLIRKEQDRDYDGQPDTWSIYEKGELVSRTLDSNADGNVDVWEEYADGRMTARVVDRDNDGVKDAFFLYEGDSLAREQHDANNDGEVDLIVEYENRYRQSSVEDTDRDGEMDSWTSYEVVEGREIVTRVEQDTDSDGKRDLFETYEAREGRPELAKREEDKNGDGQVDVTSLYENGRLKSRQISDPSLVPL